jgi:hypothetical protein
LIAAVYLFVNNVTYKGPFGLMLHCSSHRPLFRKEVAPLNYLIPWVLAPFFGQSPETYFAHHVGMHHVENNMEDDESSTMPYQRDSGKGFTRYFFTFLFTGIYTLVQYHFNKRSKKLAWRTVRGELLFIAFCTALCFVNWQATLVVFILPFLAFRLVAMAGNWVQHTFICPEQPGQRLPQQHHLHQREIQPQMLERRLPHQPPHQPHIALDRASEIFPGSTWPSLPRTGPLCSRD